MSSDIAPDVIDVAMEYEEDINDTKISRGETRIAETISPKEKVKTVPITKSASHDSQ